MIYGDLLQGNTVEMIFGRSLKLLFLFFSLSQFSRYSPYLSCSSSIENVVSNVVRYG